MTSSDKKRVAVIGCGPCGISVLSSFVNAERKGEIIPEIVCFEKQANISGQWNSSWRVGIDEHGENVHTSCYYNLWSNSPKECIEMADYTFMDHFKKLIPTYIPRSVIQDYILGKARKYDVNRFVRLNTVVRNVQEKDGKFSVHYHKFDSNSSSTEMFDYVIVAIGHFSVPHFPYYPGIETFNGRSLHAHDLRGFEEFKDKRVLLIGSNWSAEDIALQCYKFGTKEVIISFRSNPIVFKFPDNVKQVSQLVRYENGQFHFSDGSAYSVDVVIFCTGYLHSFPFMADNIKLSATNVLYPDHLYKGIFFESNTRVIYMGMQDQAFTFSMFDAQAWYVRDYIMGKIILEGEKEMRKDMDSWISRFKDVKSLDEAFEFQGSYVKDLLQVNEFPSV